MFKGIYNVHFSGLQFSAVNIISKLGKNRVHLSYIFLKFVRSGQWLEGVEQWLMTKEARIMPNVAVICISEPLTVGLAILSVV